MRRDRLDGCRISWDTVVKETQLHRELLDYYRRQGRWARKWPDSPVSRMEEAGGGKLRFSLPKPFDLVLCDTNGRFGAVECKLARSPIFHFDERARRQIRTLLDLPLAAYIALAVNFRFTRARSGRVNRAFLLHRDELRYFDDHPSISKLTLEEAAGMAVALTWRPRTGWA